YRDLDIRHLGSIYEGILEYSPLIAEQDLVVIKRGSGDKTYEEYVPTSELSEEEKQQLAAWHEAIEENRENPRLPRGCKIVGYKEKGQYFLVYGGRESKRKSSGSYYTPDYIVQYIVENTLGPLVHGECRPKPEPLPDELKKMGLQEEPTPTGPLSSNEILDLKVLDPAMGSGHFLVAATEYLARAYGEALIREGKSQDVVVSDEAFIRYKRMVVERCIYGVDINPMAVELAKLSLWLFTMDRGRPLSFLNHHLRCGNSLIGAWIKDLGKLPEFDRSGKPKKKQIAVDQGNLFEYQFKAKVPHMIRDVFGIMKQETLTYQDIQAKKALDHAVEEMKRPFKNVADMWVGSFFGEAIRDYDAILSNVAMVRGRRSIVAEERRFFHWELEFTEVFFDEKGRSLAEVGFDAVVGNPPYGGLVNKDQAVYIMYIFDWVQYRPETYLAFVQQATQLSGTSGLSAMIIPDNWMYLDFTEKMRRLLLESHKLQSIVALPSTVFSDATVDTSIFVVGGSPTDSISITTYQKKANIQFKIKEPDFYEKTSAFLESISLIINPYLTPVERTIVNKIRDRGKPLSDIAKVNYGLKAYQVGKGTPPQTRKLVEDKPFTGNQRINSDFAP
ncbi:MAG: BREX-1 system adenine-specific DNA-methyltransferase PglX, partial [Nitrospira sp.]|nr:BREX-1 system adenine-specific DNA-methyltransferase PglX [Nitrospira sp.]